MESGTINFNARKTGLFKPVWMADLWADDLQQGGDGKIPVLISLSIIRQFF